MIVKFWNQFTFALEDPNSQGRLLVDVFGWSPEFVRYLMVGVYFTITGGMALFMAESLLDFATEGVPWNRGGPPAFPWNDYPEGLFVAGGAVAIYLSVLGTAHIVRDTTKTDTNE